MARIASVCAAAALALAIPACLSTPAAGAAQATPEGAEQTPAQPDAGRARRELARAARACVPSVEAGSGQIAAGESLVVRGTLQCADGVEAAGRTVTLYEHSAGGERGFAAIADTTVEADGSYRFEPTTPAVTTAFFVRADSRRSTRVRVLVTPALTVQAPPDGAVLLPGGRHAAASAVSFSGTVTPAGAGALVVLQRERPAGSGIWRRIGASRVDDAGDYSITHTFRLPGEARVRLLVRSAGRLATAASEPLTYEIAQRQNPRLEILAPTRPVPYGATIAISGVAAGMDGQPVELLARARGGAFASVAQSTTDSSGGYHFSQPAAQNGTYMVRVGRTRSATRFVGVSYALVPDPPAGPAQPGEQLQLTGSAAPAAPGTPVYLERENASGLAFHVVCTGAVGAESRYEISCVPGAGGTYRVAVAASEGNVLATSAPFALG